jgi:hypothetical protein
MRNHILLWSDDLKERDHLEYHDVDEEIILKCLVRREVECCRRIWTELAFVIPLMKFCFHKYHGFY